MKPKEIIESHNNYVTQADRLVIMNNEGDTRIHWTNFIIQKGCIRQLLTFSIFID